MPYLSLLYQTSPKFHLPDAIDHLPRRILIYPKDISKKIKIITNLNVNQVDLWLLSYESEIITIIRILCD